MNLLHKCLESPIFAMNFNNSQKYNMFLRLHTAVQNSFKLLMVSSIHIVAVTYSGKKRKMLKGMKREI